MQHSPEEIKRRLLTCIDKDCNVTDMATCMEIISILEQTPITRKVLEDTRLGKIVNDVRRRTNHHELLRRAKNLVRKWRDACQAENGLMPNRGQSSGPGPGPGPGGGVGRKGIKATEKVSRNGRQSISPIMANQVSNKPQSGAPSPNSFNSSGTTSPTGIGSAPTTPSTLSQKNRTSPTLSIAKANISESKSIAIHSLDDYSFSAANISNTTQSVLQNAPNNSSSTNVSISKFESQTAALRQAAKSESVFVENVPRTCVANKRLRKDTDDSPSENPAKRFKAVVTNGYEEDCSRDSFSSVVSNDQLSRTSGDGGSINISLYDSSQKGPGKKSRQRRMKADSSKKDSATLDPLKQKMAVIGAKSSKVKTTSQIVAELAEKKGDTQLAKTASRLEGQVKEKGENSYSTITRDDFEESMSKNKMEHMQRFLGSEPDPMLEEEVHRCKTPSPETSSAYLSASTFKLENQDDSTHCESQPIAFPTSPVSNMDLLCIKEEESAEEILLRLPPMDVDCLDLDDVTYNMRDKNEDEEMGPSIYSDAEAEELNELADNIDKSVVDTLHNTNVDCQNGNYDMDARFREWHEVMLRKAYQDTPLVVLPYVITDY